MFGRRAQLELKSPDEIRLMRQAGLVVSAALTAAREAATAGVSTDALDRVAETVIRDHGARPSFPEVPGYAHTLCVSVNEQVVHGIPGDRVLAEGDLVSVDCGAILADWHGDAAVSFVVGGRDAARPGDLALMDATEASLWAGIAAFREGRDLNDVGGAIEDCVEDAAASAGLTFGIVDGYTGHGIGREMHMDPDVYNYRVQGRTPRVRAGATVAIEPMITLGTAATEVLADDWTVVTADGSRASHWEHTVAATSGGIWVLTAADGGAARLHAMGAPYGPLD